MAERYEEIEEIGRGARAVVDYQLIQFFGERLLEVMSNEYGVRLVFEYLDIELHDYIRKRLVYLKSPPHAIKGILRHILLGVAYCHSHKIIHRDLKPKSILLDVCQGIVKIADFELARPLDPPINELSGGSNVLQAPEILLSFTNYSFPIDMWPVGCIFVEMVNFEGLEPLFFTAQTENGVLFKIFSICGVPTEETWPSVTSCPLLKDGIAQFSIPQQELGEVIKLEPAGLDLLSKMLCMNPADRISTADALDHEYLKSS